MDALEKPPQPTLVWVCYINQSHNCKVRVWDNTPKKSYKAYDIKLDEDIIKSYSHYKYAFKGWRLELDEDINGIVGAVIVHSSKILSLWYKAYCIVCEWWKT